MKSKIKILTVLGTRPEAIKLAPFISAVESDSDCSSILCVSTQHKELQNDILSLFDIKVNYDLNVMRKSQDLFHVTEAVLSRLKSVLEKEDPDFVVVQGDTTTAFSAGLSAFYNKIPLVHIEAGLRTGNLYSPFPEETNRNLISKIATLHMAPTKKAVENLANEGIVKNVFFTGNTIVDSIEMVLNLSRKESNIDNVLESHGQKVLITVHRRENFGEPLKEICSAIRELSQTFPHILFIWPVHPNPNIKEQVMNYMSTYPNVLIIEPLSYEPLIRVISACALVLSDSGGIQEECCILEKPILVLREKTERPEVLESGWGELVGSNREKIVSRFNTIITEGLKNKAISSKGIYGEVGVSNRILDIMKSKFIPK